MQAIKEENIQKETQSINQNINKRDWKEKELQFDDKVQINSQ